MQSGLLKRTATRLVEVSLHEGAFTSRFKIHNFPHYVWHQKNQRIWPVHRLKDHVFHRCIVTQENWISKVWMSFHQENEIQIDSSNRNHHASDPLCSLVSSMSQGRMGWFLYFLTFPHYGSSSIPHFRSLVLFTIFDCKTPLKEKHLSCCHSEPFLLMDNHWMVHCICNGFLRNRIILFYVLHTANNQSISNHYFLTWSKICTKRMVHQTTTHQRTDWVLNKHLTPCSSGMIISQWTDRNECWQSQKSSMIKYWNQLFLILMKHSQEEDSIARQLMNSMEDFQERMKGWEAFFQGIESIHLIHNLPKAKFWILFQWLSHNEFLWVT